MTGEIETKPKKDTWYAFHTETDAYRYYQSFKNDPQYSCVSPTKREYTTIHGETVMYWECKLTYFGGTD